MKAAIDVLSQGGITAPVAITKQNLELNTMLNLEIANRKIVGVLMGDAVPQLAIPKLIEYHKEGRCPFDKLVKFYKFEEINEAAADPNSGATIKPILIVNETYRQGDRFLFKIKDLSVISYRRKGCSRSFLLMGQLLFYLHLYVNYLTFVWLRHSLLSRHIV